MVALVEAKGGNHYMDNVYLFKCDYDWDKAFQRALEIGRQQEEEYINYESVMEKFPVK